MLRSTLLLFGLLVILAVGCFRGITAIPSYFYFLFFEEWWIETKVMGGLDLFFTFVFWLVVYVICKISMILVARRRG